jgi:hypothetical protein
MTSASSWFFASRIAPSSPVSATPSTACTIPFTASRIASIRFCWACTVKSTKGWITVSVGPPAAGVGSVSPVLATIGCQRPSGLARVLSMFAVT